MPDSKIIDMCSAFNEQKVYTLLWDCPADKFALAVVALPFRQPDSEESRGALLEAVNAQLPSDPRWLSAREALAALDEFQAPPEFQEMARLSLDVELTGGLFRG